MFTSLGQRIIVRYARKPIWMPTAKSKIFRITNHTFYSPDEVKQIAILKTAYQAQEKSIGEFMKHEFYIPVTQSGGLPPEFIKKELEADRALIEENECINAEVAKTKEEYFKQQIKILEAKLLEEKERIEEQLLKTAQDIDDYVRENKSNPERFVTPDNIDAIIEKALENPVTYEFYIDRGGRRYGSNYGVMSSRSEQVS